MKKKLIFINCFSLFLISTKAQTTYENGNTRSDFIKQTQVRYIDANKATQKIIESQSIKINYLKNLSDTMSKYGNISDTSKIYINQKINNFLNYNDSISTVLKLVESNFNNYTKLKKNYLNYLKSANNTNSYVEKMGMENSNYLYSLESELKKLNKTSEKKQLKTILNNAVATQAKETTAITNISKSTLVLLKKGNIDSSTATNVNYRINNYQRRIDSLSKEIDTLENSIKTPEIYSKNMVLIRSKILIIDSVINKSASIRQYKYEMIAESLQKTNKILFSLAAFFGAGGYQIPEDKMIVAQKYFSPVVDSLVKFCNKYNTINRVATIQVKGYADGSLIANTSTIYPIITNLISNQNPTKEELNNGLSLLRATELSNLFTKIITNRKVEFINSKQILFRNIEAGMGEALPDAKITDYKENDERRRIVIISWSVLPEE